MIAYLPLITITIILSRLPPKSISRFKCVSKTRWSLIPHPEFVKLQLHHANQNCNFSFFIHKYRSCFVTMDNENDENAYKKEVEREIDLIDNRSRIEIIGSCNGLVGIYCSGDLFLYNPSTNELLKLPVLKLTVEPDLLGFGYVHKDNKFKVIAHASWDVYSTSSHYIPSRPSYAYKSSPYSPHSRGRNSPSYSPTSPVCYPLSSSISPYFKVHTLGTESWEKK